MSSVVYWIHHVDHTDMFTQGYIGITNNIKKRWYDHKNKPSNAHLKHAISKYGWDNLVKEVVLIADEAYCLMMEVKLRAENAIGWNITKGGGMPPKVGGWNKGKKIPKEKLDALKAKGFGFKKGNKTWNTGITLTEEQKQNQFKIGEFTKGKAPHNKGKPMTLEHKEKFFQKVICPHCNKEGNAGNIARYHMDKCKYKGASS